MLLQIGKKAFILKETSSYLVKVLIPSKYYETSTFGKSFKLGDDDEYDNDSYRNEYQSKQRSFKNSQMFHPNSRHNRNSENWSHSSSRTGWNNRILKDRKSSARETDRTPIITEKYFYVEHPDIVSRSEEEAEKYRKLLNMSIKGVNIPKPITKFSELCLPEKLMTALNEENYSEPTAIQSQSWPVALSGRDMIGVSQTGSGKTLAYMLPAVVHASNQNRQTDQRKCKPQVLVLGPTRELVQQIHQVSHKFIKACGLMGATAYGGASKINQLRNLEGAEVCIATPGRLIDFIASDQVSVENCSYLVLDEADRMLDMGFEPQIRDIIDQIRTNRQTLMWSATWPFEIRSLAEEFLSNFIHVKIGSSELVANPNIEQRVYVTTEDKKEEKLISLLTDLLQEGENKVLVFAKMKRTVDYLSNMLNRKRFPALCIHGDISQSRRDQALKYFRKNKSSVLIATDVAARGLDVSDISHVVNYDFPENIESYIHRIGRTARGSASGVSHSFLTSENAGLVKDLISVLEKCNQVIDPEIYDLEGYRKVPMKFKNNRYRGRGVMY